jgi:hypothetical protein
VVITVSTSASRAASASTSMPAGTASVRTSLLASPSK